MSANRPKYEIIDISNIEVMADVSLLQKTDDLFFNATHIAKQFGKLPADFLRLDATREYIDEILKDSQYGISHSENLVRVTNGGKYRGTWLHKELAFEFAGWCSPAFRRKLHKWAESRLNEEHQRRLKRLEARTGFLPLTNAIQAAHTNTKPYHYSNECDLLNKLVTGMTAKKFKEVRGVDSVRDALSVAQIQLLDRLQRQNTALIELGFTYDDRKQILQKSAAGDLLAA